MSDRLNVATRLVALAGDAGDFWHSPSGDPFVSVDGTSWLLDTARTRQWLAGLLDVAEGRTPEGSDIKAAAATLAARARGGEEREPPEDSDLSEDDDDRPKSQATVLVELATARADLWVTPDDQAFATLDTDGHREHWALRSTRMRRWLAGLLYESAGKAPGSQAVADALAVLESQALFEGPRHDVHVRVAGHDGRIYLDLADESWRAVEVTRDGWAIVTDPPVRFRRPRGLHTLPEPVPGGKVVELRRFVNVSDEGDFALVTAWLLAALRPVGPYPVLALHGEQGSAKSMTARMLAKLVDPSSAGLRAEPRDVRDLMIAATNGWTVSLDNLSPLTPWISDALCRLSTGGGFAARELYSDDEEKIFDAQRPIILNGIAEVATRGDLLDRCLVVSPPRIPEDARRAEAELLADFDAARPRLLGALLDAVACGLRRVDDVRLDRLPRMADFAIWAEACAPALGLADGEFVEVYAGNRDAAAETALEDSPVVEPVRALAVEGFEGISAELLAALGDRVDENTTRGKAWPKSPRGLSGSLRRLAPALRAVGVDVEFLPRAHSGRRLISVRTAGADKGRDRPSPPSPPSPAAAETASEREKRPDPAGDGRVTVEPAGDGRTPAGDGGADADRHREIPRRNGDPDRPGPCGDGGDGRIQLLSDGRGGSGPDPDLSARAERLAARHADLAAEAESC